MVRHGPTGSFGKLYDIVSTYTDHPVGEIERIAKQALSEGVIDEKRYVVLQYRIPFSGFERETLKQVGNRLGVTMERSRQLEYSTYVELKRYLPKL